MKLLFIIGIALLVYYLIYDNGAVEKFQDFVTSFENFGKFITMNPPKILSSPPNWSDTYVGKAGSWDKEIRHANVLVHYWPMQKPPANMERTPEAVIDITRPQFIPHMAKRSINASARAEFPRSP